MVAIVASDLYPAVRRFLLESGLQRALKAFEKETTTEEPISNNKSKKAKVLAELELTAACQLWLDARLPVAVNGEHQLASEGEPRVEPPSKKKKGSKAAEEAFTPTEAAGEAVQEGGQKRKRTAEEVAEKPSAGATAGAEAEAEAAEEGSEVPKRGKKAKKKETLEKPPGVPFKRIDDEKWIKVIKDPRLLDNTHKAKDKFGESQGDTWADKAAEDMLKVKGKGFRKEMAKKKRASWRGGGEIDQGVNSIKFDDSEEEE